MPKRLKVALYIPWIYQKGGVERTFLELIKRSRHDWTIFTHRFEPRETFSEYSKLKVVQVGRVPLKRGFFELASAATSMMLKKIDLSGFDVFVVSTAGFAEFVALRNDSIPTIAFCHTPLRVIHDEAIREKYLLENAGNPLTIAKYKFFEQVYTNAEKKAWKKFRFTIVASGEVAGRLERAGICPKEKIRKLKYGVDTQKCVAAKSRNYFLLPGRISWTKNVGLGIRAFELMRKQHPATKEFSLVVAGGIDQKSMAYFEELSRKPGPKIRFVANPSDKELFKLYAESYAVLFTAINEDWGLVPVEAMAFSKPVIAANQGGPRESVIDGVTGFLAKPTEEDFAKKMAALAKNPSLAKKMGQAGRRRAMQYDWGQSARHFDDLVESALG